MKTVLIDDEKNNLDNLRQLLNAYCPSVQIVGAAINAAEGKKIIHEQKPDLLFLDIQMPQKTGFDLLRELDDYSFEVIFVTAYDHFAIQAVRFAAVDYLLKPVNIEELRAAVDRAESRGRQKKQNQQLENLLQLLHQKKDEHRIALATLKETRFVNTRAIIRCESSNNYTSFFLKDGEKLIVSKPIYEFEEMLEGYGFLRPHQSHLVNRIYIKSLLKEDGGTLLLEDGSLVPVSRSKKEEVLRSLSQ
ncbi:LytTR family DNA-binding domain-containing protein [Terrimonas sp. NA20]|uniref:LytTR family DNA-binding domain-containing protein n=1 Tax=Terrimonas ginsenosidimutans TaxID=2908004 RepID=A0ABS9KXN3_9BACT|nr:LytTR family DNA-binding domain-containing protein [Terrimonas ginsenosidimutans]MCG2617070.1 LytTR family DNA-binding domain-containing protein [Terrimonas ginsenosidimutans]